MYVHVYISYARQFKSVGREERPRARSEFI